MEIINFDYKKLESYKTAMDDGFIARNKISEIEFISCGRAKKGTYYLFVQDLIDGAIVEEIKEKDWETFKEKIQKVFEENK